MVGLVVSRLANIYKTVKLDIPIKFDRKLF